MTDSQEARMRPTQRQAGFNVTINSDAPQYSSRVRTTTGDTVIKGSSDGDIEMGDDKVSIHKNASPLTQHALIEQRGILPLLIPSSSDTKVSNDTSLAASQKDHASDLPTPPDDALLSASASRKANASSHVGRRLSSFQPHPASPRLATISSSHVSSGSASFSSTHWSPIKSADQPLYSISGQPYSNASIKPYLSTSFQLSAERGGAMRHSRGNDQMEDEDEDDVFGDTSQGLGLLHGTNDPSPPQDFRSSEMRHEDGDAAGVFDFSSPYFGPRSLETSDVPPLSPPPTSEATSQAQQILSPTWTAATLGKLSLGDPGSEAPVGRKLPFGASSRLPTSHASSLQSQSLPSGSMFAPLSSQHRMSSFSKRAQVGSNGLHAHSTIHRHTARARSSSRHRQERASTSRTVDKVEDEDETDEDELMAGRDQEDDDATEDESDFRSRPMYVSRYARNDDAAHNMPHRHASGQQTTMSASYERAQSGLTRQFSSDRYPHLAFSRHHPYAASPSNASPGNAGMLAYSPSNARAAFGRRRSSFGSNGALSASPSGGVLLSHSPRYLQSVRNEGYPAAIHSHAYSGALHGSSPDARVLYEHRNSIEDEEDAEDDEGAEYDGEMRPSTGNRSGKPRSGSTARPSAISLNANQDVESPEMGEVNAIRDRLGGAANCSAFISKLWYLMCRPELYSKYIHWSESGDSVILSNDTEINNEFASDVLPKLFKHGNNASFVRQLNLYGFQRVPSSRLLDVAEVKAAQVLPNGSSISTALQLYGPHSSFAHPRFKKDQEALLPSMKPRSSKKTKKANTSDSQRDARGGGESEGDNE